MSQPTTEQAPRAWTETGEKLFDREASNRQGHCYAASRDVVEAAIEELTWCAVEEHLSVPFSPGAAINAAISELSLPRVSRIAHDGAVPVRDDVERASSLYGLYGIEANFTNGRVRVFLVDRGTDVLPVAVDHWPTDPTQD